MGDGYIKRCDITPSRFSSTFFRTISTKEIRLEFYVVELREKVF